LGLTPEEIAENQNMWLEENSDSIQSSADPGEQMRGVGITPGGIETDIAGLDAEAPGEVEAEPEVSDTDLGTEE